MIFDVEILLKNDQHTEAHFFPQESSLTHRFSVRLHRFSVCLLQHDVFFLVCAAKLKIYEPNLIPAQKCEPLHGYRTSWAIDCKDGATQE